MLSTNLKQRIATAVVLIPVLLGALFFLPAKWIAVMFGVFIGVGAWEWSRLAGIRGSGRQLYVVAILLGGAIPVVLLLTNADHTWFVWLMGGVTVFWFAALVEMVRGASGKKMPPLYASPEGKRLCGFFVLIPTWLAAVYLVVVDGQRPLLLLYAMSLVWAGDTFAYFAGHNWGAHKLAPTVSPGKTIEGVVGGLLGGTLLAIPAGAVVWGKSGNQLVGWVLLSAVVVLVSVLGDLVESQFKRLAGVKDSGSILPGHGGVLDRIDALTAALPVFAFGWYWMTRGII